jgi:hypothetical protein
MQFFDTAFVTAVLASSMLAGGAHMHASAPAQPAAGPSATPSEILKPGLDHVRLTLDALKLDKWKKGSIRDEAGANINTIQRDLQVTLPPLLATADAAPGTISKVLPVTRNIDAVYDVLVHVVEAARVVAPGDQVGLLQQSMSKLEKSRVALDEQLEQIAAAQEKQMTDLHNTVQTQAAQLHAAATPPPAPVCPAPAPAKKKKKPAATTAPKPATNSTTTAPTTTPTAPAPAPAPAPKPQ